jgi:hypothetical protein
VQRVRPWHDLVSNVILLETVLSAVSKEVICRSVRTGLDLKKDRAKKLHFLPPSLFKLTFQLIARVFLRAPHPYTHNSITEGFFAVRVVRAYFLGTFSRRWLSSTGTNSRHFSFYSFTLYEHASTHYCYRYGHGSKN